MAAHQESGLAEPEAVREATSAYKADSDAVGRFLASECFVSPAAWASVSDLWDAWTAWAAEGGAEPLSKKAFGEAMDRAGYPAVKGAKGMRIRRGIGLLSADEDDS